MLYTCRVTSESVSLLDRVRGVIENGPPLRLAVVFGSGARDALRPESDVDVGIVPRDYELSLAAEFDLQTRLERACGRPVDLIRLDRASTLLRWEAARGARLVLADPPVEFSRFLAMAALEHAELMTSLAPAAAGFRRRLLERGDAAAGVARSHPR